MLGLLEVGDPHRLGETIREVRDRLASDPYLAAIPSMADGAGKTAALFHAKDDCPEVRWQVFAALRGLSDSLRFFAVVCDKLTLAAGATRGQGLASSGRCGGNELYDALVRRLFRDRLHKADGYVIRFAARGKSDRTGALRDAILRARERFAAKWGIVSDAPFGVEVVPARAHVGLQAVDYYLWALQRAYERQEGRYLDYLWPSVHLVHDISDTREQPYGVYYTQKNPLTVERVRERL